MVTPLLNKKVKIVLWVSHRGGRQYELITPLSNGSRIITSNLTGASDMSGLDQEKMLIDMPFKMVLDYHLECIGPHRQKINPFNHT